MILYLVDDEQNVRETILSSFSWTELGISHVYGARNGRDALEKMAVNPPDILLTDISMPIMNGIDLATAVHDRYPECVIIFLSGYADKEYLKSAIHLGALEYIEKPISIDLFKSTVQSAVDKVLSLRDTRDYQDYLENVHQNNLPLMKQTFFYDITSNEFNHISEQSLETINRTIATTSIPFRCITYKITYPETLSQQEQFMHANQLIGILNTDKDDCLKIYGYYVPDQITLFIFGDVSSHDYEDYLAAFSESICYPYYMCTSVLYTNLSKIRSAYLETMTLIPYTFYMHTGTSLLYNTDYNKVSIISSNYSDDMMKAIRSENKSTVYQLLIEFAEDMQNTHPLPEDFTQYCMAMLNQISHQITISCGVDSDNTHSCNFLFNRLSCVSSMSDAIQILMSAVDLLYSQGITLKTDDTRIQSVISYINGNISVASMSISTISKAMGLSQNYLSSYFKNATGKTINQYITDTRIAMSKRMLLETDEKIYSIAERVGLKDTNYFSSLFRKQTGVTPLEFRRNRSNTGFNQSGESNKHEDTL